MGEAYTFLLLAVLFVPFLVFDAFRLFGLSFAIVAWKPSHVQALKLPWNSYSDFSSIFSKGSKMIPVWSWLQMGKDLLMISLRYVVGAWRIEPIKLKSQ